MRSRLMAEATGTFFLVMASMGAGLMAIDLSPGMSALALLANAFATGLALFVLITVFAPVSGAHFNPAVTLFLLLGGQMRWPDGLRYIVVQTCGALLAVPLTHAMFSRPLVQIATTVRDRPGLWLGELIATFGLLMVIAVGTKTARGQVPVLVAAWVASAYWFTSSAIFGNPAVTLARTFSDSFTGIRPEDAPAYVLCQCAAAGLAALILPLLTGTAGHPPESL